MTSWYGDPRFFVFGEPYRAAAIVPPLAHRMTPRHAFRADVASRIGAEKDAQGRVWCQLFPLGKWHRSDFPGGELELTTELFGEFIANWKAGGSPALPVDYNHDEDGPASGWIEDLRIGPTGCLEGATKWNERAAAEIKADEKRYLSPTWAMQHVNRTSGEKGGPWLYGAALLNDPFFDSMPRVAATAIAEPTQPPITKEHIMFTDEQLKALRANLFLAADATPDLIIAATKPLTASASETVEKLTASVRMTGDLETKLQASQARVAELETLTAKHAEDEAKHKAELFSRDFTAAYEAELAAGRQGLPDLKDTLLATAQAQGLDVAKKLMAALPTVKLAAAGVAGDDKPGTDLQKFEAAIEAKVKAGMKWTDASKAVAAEMPDLAAKLFTNSTRA